jgi:hypothetical protein
LQSDDATAGALTVCECCLAILSTEGGEVKFFDYNSMDMTGRAMVVQGINAMLAHFAMSMLSQKISESKEH